MEQLLEKQGDGEAGVNSEQGPRGGRPRSPSLFPRASSLFTGLAGFGRPGVIFNHA